MMSAAAELQRDIVELEREHDALVRAIARKHVEFDLLNKQIRQATDRLDQINANIKRIKQHFGVPT
jgi:hypothetical protein